MAQVHTFQNRICCVNRCRQCQRIYYVCRSAPPERTEAAYTKIRRKKKKREVLETGPGSVSTQTGCCFQNQTRMQDGKIAAVFMMNEKVNLCQLD